MSDFEDALIKNAGGEATQEPTPEETAKPEDTVEDTPQVEETPEAGIESSESTEPEVEASSNEPEALKEEGTESAEESPTETEPEGAQLFEDWDSVENTPEIPEDAVNVDATSVLKDLGFDGLSVEQAQAKIQEMKDASVVDRFEGVPDNLKEAIELAKNDGDWLEFLGVTSVDYNNISDDVLLTNNLAHYFTNAEGVLDREGLEDYMDEMSDVDRQIRARQIRDQLVGQQQLRKQDLERQAEQRRAEADRQLRAALDKAEDIRGFKLTAANKKKIFEGISSGDMIREMFQDKAGNWDWGKVITNYFNHLYGSKADSYMKQRITSSTKKDFLKKLSNVEVEAKPSDLPEATPEQMTAQKQMVKDLLDFSE
jgi:hypothetical protein